MEVCINGVWGSVCSSGWDETDAFVTCKQLGYGNAGKNQTVCKFLDIYQYRYIYLYAYTFFSLIIQNQLVTQILSLVKVRGLLCSQIWTVKGGRKTSSNATGQNMAHSRVLVIN